MKKKCKKCKIEKELTDFYISRKKYVANCKKCMIQKNNRKNKTPENKKQELKEELEFRVDCIKALFNIDGFKFQ